MVPTRYFLGKPQIGEELTISIEKGKTLTIKLLAVGTLNTETGTRECFFELNGEVSLRYDSIEGQAHDGRPELWSLLIRKLLLSMYRGRRRRLILDLLARQWYAAILMDVLWSWC